MLNIISFGLLDYCIFFLLQKPSVEWRGKHFKMPTKMKTRLNIFLEKKEKKVFLPRVKWNLMVFLLTYLTFSFYCLFYEPSVNHNTNESQGSNFHINDAIIYFY